MKILYSAIASGVLNSALIALGAIGFTMQFAVSNLFNLSYAAVMTLSMFAAYKLQTIGLGLWPCVALGALTGAVLSYTLNTILYRPFRRRSGNPVTVILATLTAGLVIENVLEGLVGATFFPFTLSNKPVKIGPFRYTGYEIVIIILAIVAMSAVQVLMRSTKLGRAMRATAEDIDLAGNCGIGTDRVADISWLISGLLCGLCGVLLALTIGSFTPTTGDEFLITIAAAAIVGGIGRPVGAILGALIVGTTAEVVAIEISPAYNAVAGFGLVVLVLLFRPQGILGTVRVRVA